MLKTLYLRDDPVLFGFQPLSVTNVFPYGLEYPGPLTVQGRYSRWLWLFGLLLKADE